MTATGHALIGTVIAAKIGNPAFAVPIALASHFAADALPHWDTGHNRQKKSKSRFFVLSFIDVLFSFVLSWLLIIFIFPSTNLSYAFLMIIIAQLPDWLTAPYLFFNMRFAPFCWVYNIQKFFDRSIGMPWGIINQVAAVLIIIFLGRLF